MKNKANPPPEAAELRRRAEARLKAGAKLAATDREGLDPRRLVHELQVHQIELEMQNEELRESRAQLEALLERYGELYDFAPVGYLTLGRDGTIQQVNLAGARILGVARTGLQGRRLGGFHRCAGTLRFQRLSGKDICKPIARGVGGSATA